MNDRALLVDLSAASSADEEDVRAYFGDKRVFVSSVILGLEEDRASVAAAVRGLGATAVLFEEFGGREDDPEAAYLSEVAASDVYVGILGRRYGRLLPSRRSATHEEFRKAEAVGLRISCWVRRSDEFEGDQQTFLDEIRTFHTTGAFSSAADLGSRIAERLRQIAAEDVSPWCKLSNVVFRASAIKTTSQQIIVVLQTRDDNIATALEAVGQGPFGRGRDTTFAFPGGFSNVVVEEIETDIRSATARKLTIVMKKDERQTNSLNDVSFNLGTSTYSADDLTEMALRISLLGEKSPSDHFLTALMPKIPNPLSLLKPLGISEERLRPICKLLLAESLISQGRARRIARFQFGVAVDGRRPLRLAWETPQRYANTPTELRAIEGEITA